MTSADAIALLVVGCYVVLAMLSHRAFIAFEKASDKPSLSPEMLAIMAACWPVIWFAVTLVFVRIQVTKLRQKQK